MMTRKVILAALAGGFVMILWALVVNGILGFKAGIEMKTLPNEAAVYETLKTNVSEPGRYAVNPPADPERGYPQNEPAFSVLYGGVGHEAAGRIALLQLPVFFLAPLIAAWMLSVASRRILARYFSRVLFVAAIGLIIALYGRMMEFGIAGYPASDATALAVYDLCAWLMVGLVMARLIHSAPASEA